MRALWWIKEKFRLLCFDEGKQKNSSGRAKVVAKYEIISSSNNAIVDVKLVCLLMRQFLLNVKTMRNY